MPSLEPVAHRNEVAFVWGCTECSAIFDVGRRIHTGLSRTETERINRAFREHCAAVHQGSSGIPSPTQPEDAMKEELILQGKATNDIWAMAAPDGLIGLCLDSGVSGTVYLTKEQARTVIATLQKMFQ